MRYINTRLLLLLLIGNNTQFIEWYRFQYPWERQDSSDPDFKVTPFFDTEYLRNDTRYSHSYYRTSIGSQALY